MGFKMKVLLVTGVAGFIGSNFIKYFRNTKGLYSCQL